MVSALTQPAIGKLDLATEATNTVRDIRWGAHRLECLFISTTLPITYQHQIPSNLPHTGPWVEQGTDNNNNNSIPFSLSVKTNGDSDLDETLTQYA